MINDKIKEIYNCFIKSKPDNTKIPSLNDIELLWLDIINLNKNKEQEALIDTPKKHLTELYILECYCLALSINYQKQKTIKEIFVTITNTIFSIYKLAMDGLDYSAKVLLRTLFEIFLTLLNIIIDKNKKEKLESVKTEAEEKKIWCKYFKADKLKETILNYENSIAKEQLSQDWQESLYKHFSAFVHNDYQHFSLYIFAKPENQIDYENLNLCGDFASRSENIFDAINEILFYTTTLFYKLLTDSAIDLKVKNMISNNCYEIWQSATILQKLTSDYFITTKE